MLKHSSNRMELFNNRAQHYYNKWFSVLAACYYLVFLWCFIELRFFGSVYQSVLFRVVIAFMVISYYVFYQFQGGQEIHILTMYCLWAAITCVIHGNILEYWESMLELLLMFVWFAPGILLYGKERDRYYNKLAWVTVLFFAALGMICVYTAATRSLVINPLTGLGIGYHSPSEWRLSFMALHPNSTSGLYLISFCLSLTLLFRTDRFICKVLVFFTACIEFIVIALTISRNAQTFACVALGLMVSILVSRKLEIRKSNIVSTAIFFLIVAVVVLLSYRLYEPIRKELWTVYERQQITTSDVQESMTGYKTNRYELKLLSDTSKQEESAAEFKEDTRDYLKSGRKEIYWSAWKSLQMEPSRLLYGAPIPNVMDISNSLIKEQATNFHNCFLQVVNEFGLPGLFLVLTFFFLVIKNGIFVIANRDQQFSIKEQMLILPVIAMMGYNMLEAESFCGSDFRADFFFFACGMLTGVFREKTYLQHDNTMK